MNNGSGRKRNVTGSGTGMNRRGSGLGTRPVGRPGGYGGNGGSGGSGGSGGGGNRGIFSSGSGGGGYGLGLIVPDRFSRERILGIMKTLCEKDAAKQKP